MQPDDYLLGRGEAEEARLKRQIADLAPDSDPHFEKIGIKPGERVVDLGCGPGGVLQLLGKRVGPTGSVVGVERSPHFVDLARRFIASHGLPQAAYSAARRAHRLFRDAGLADIRVDAVIHVYPPGHERRPILRDFINNVREKLIDGGFITRSELERDMIALERYLSDSRSSCDVAPVLPAVGARPAERIIAA